MPKRSDDLATIGDRARARREELGLSQDEVAKKAKLHRTYIGGFERGERNISISNLLKIAKALGVEPGFFVDYLDEQV